MPLTTYEEVRPWAKAIKHEVLTRRMPPWGAVKGFGAFRNDASLSLPEIAVISSWVEGGAPEGDAAFLEPFHLHGEVREPPAAEAGSLPVRGAVVLDRPLLVTGVSPGLNRRSEWLQLTAHLPDGQVEHMIWLRGSLPNQELHYWFVKPLELPAGTRLLCQPESGEIAIRFREGRD